MSDWVDEGMAVDIVYLDFKKAFDKVPRRRLFAKVRTCGVAGQVANWIVNWLSGQKQRVVVSGRMSCWEDVRILRGISRISTRTITIHYFHQRFG